MAVVVLVRPAPASCLGFYSQIVNTLRPTLDSFVWPLLLLSKQAYAFAVMFTGFNNTLRPTLGSFCFGQASACIVPWIQLTECEHFETNTWQFLFWAGERLHRALVSTHRM